jgi:chromatin remodeling complex protein RSC6
MTTTIDTVDTPIDTVDTPIDTVDTAETTAGSLVQTTSDVLTTAIKDMDEKFREIRTILLSLRNLKREVATLERNNTRLQSKKHKRKVSLDENGDKKKTGFSRPSMISHELADFMGIAHDQMVPRADVTKFISKYINENGLQNPEQKRFIRFNVNDAGRAFQQILSPVIGADDVQQDEIEFIFIQRHIGHHFSSTTKTTTKSTKAGELVEIDLSVPTKKAVENSKSEEFDNKSAGTKEPLTMTKKLKKEKKILKPDEIVA